MSVKCVIWDWNGTLLDDTAAALNAFNRQLIERKLPPITLDFYRNNFSFPVKSFYTQCGIELEREDWDRLAKEYHSAYAEEAKALNRDSRSALEALKSRGIRQYVLSALRQDLLDRAMEEYALGGYFDAVRGVDNLDGASKLERARELVIEIGEKSEDILFIGDALHDAEVAAAVGAKCLLTATGGHDEWRLRRVAPTVRTLLEAVNMI